MLIFFVLLIATYQYMIVEVVRLNQAGPGWEVPAGIVMRLELFKPISIILFCAIMVLLVILRKKILAHRAILFTQLSLCIIGTIFLLATNAFRGQFYYPTLLVQPVFYCAYTAITILSIIALIKIISVKHTVD